MNPKFVAILAALSALILAGGCGSDTPSGVTPSSTTASTTAATSPVKHDVVRFADEEGEGGVVLESPADASKLEGVPEDFRAFIVAELLTQQTASGTEMTDCHPKDQLVVDVIDTAGHAAGGVVFAACSGARLYWAKVDGQWRKVLEGQSEPECDAFKQYGFPVSVVEKCSQGTEVVRYAP